MTNKPNNPSAFPQERGHTVERGLTMRDYFAAKAMQSFILTSEPKINIGDLSKVSYTVADAMLEQREK